MVAYWSKMKAEREREEEEEYVCRMCMSWACSDVRGPGGGGGGRLRHVWVGGWKGGEGRRGTPGGGTPDLSARWRPAPDHRRLPLHHPPVTFLPRPPLFPHPSLQDGKILGCQATGLVPGVEKRVDVVSMCMQVGGCGRMCGWVGVWFVVAGVCVPSRACTRGW